MLPAEETTPVRMDREECLLLLGIEDIGRLAIVQGDAPAIFPVTYALDGDSIVFRTSFGSKLLHGRRNAAAFEIDGLDRERRAGWSVVVSGLLDEVTDEDPVTARRVRTLGIHPWAEGDRPHWMRLVPGTITGRRVGPPMDP